MSKKAATVIQRRKTDGTRGGTRYLIDILSFTTASVTLSHTTSSNILLNSLAWKVEA